MEGKKHIEEIFSKSLRAGRRTYFFDVRSTKAGDYYMTITESKRDFTEDGTPFYKKHKIYLYKEDFAQFQENLKEVSDYIIKEKGEEIISDTKPSKKEEVSTKIAETAEEKTEEEEANTDFIEVNFDDLGKE